MLTKERENSQTNEVGKNGVAIRRHGAKASHESKKMQHWREQFHSDRKNEEWMKEMYSSSPARDA
jgi:hypothetical protein